MAVNAPSEDVAALLESSAAGLGLTVGTDLFVAAEPDTPDACVTVYDSPGFGPDPAVADYHRPGVMVRVRGVRGGYRAAYAVALAVLEYFHTLRQQTVAGTRYVAFWAETDVNPVGVDERERPLFTVNLTVHRTPA